MGQAGSINIILVENHRKGNRKSLRRRGLIQLTLGGQGIPFCQANPARKNVENRGEISVQITNGQEKVFLTK